MSRPTKFEIMRRQRKSAANRAVVNRHYAEAEAFDFKHSEDVEHALREIDMDAIHGTRKKSAVRRWWWPVAWGAAQ